ncbi:DUF2189 domain-containing protein [Vitreimonas flagellata]|uniref:DUF2189 domain-containing protein n=1 Tax=Vitreimonas flagellata TaxID=2560861 RepID=UPI00107558DB|nr:DUF2189 domain-containing protein [Vitreimonas flagellata]
MEQAYTPPRVRSVGLDAPLRWLAEGWGDMMRVIGPSLFYGALIAAISFMLSKALINSNAAFWALALSCGFVFVAPMLAMGLYEAGRALEAGEKPTLSQMLFVRGALRQDVAYLGLALLLIYLFWGRIAQIVYGLSTFRLHTSVDAFVDFALHTSEGHSMLIAGALIGGVIAFFTYCLVVVSAPMLLDQRANVFAATFTSLRSVSQNFAPLLLWAFIITALLIASAATWFIALVVIFPWLGLASWRAYRDLVEER